jgi:protein gp37
VDIGKWLLDIGWVVVGGESGPRHRRCEVAWIQSIVAQCDAANAKVYVKQASAARPGQQGEIPDALFAVKEVPWNSPRHHRR